MAIFSMDYDESAFYNDDDNFLKLHKFFKPSFNQVRFTVLIQFFLLIRMRNYSVTASILDIGVSDSNGSNESEKVSFFSSESLAYFKLCESNKNRYKIISFSFKFLVSYTNVSHVFHP